MACFYFPAAVAAVFLFLSVPVYASEGNNSSTDLPVSIVWDDQNNLYSSRPEEVTLMVTKNGTAFQEITLSSQNNWSAEIPNVPSFSPEATELSPNTSDPAAKWILGDPDENGAKWLQYSADSNWTTSEYSVSELTDTSKTFQIVNNTQDTYLVFYKDEAGNLLSDSNGSIVCSCSAGETILTIPDNAFTFCVSYVNSDVYYSVQALNTDKQYPADYSVYPVDTAPGYLPSVSGTVINYTLAATTVDTDLSGTVTADQNLSIDISLQSSDGYADDAVLDYSNNWKESLTFFRTSPLIYFSHEGNDNTVPASSLSDHYYSVLGDSFSEASDGTAGNDPEGYSLDSKWWRQMAESLGMHLLSNQAAGGSGVNVSTTEEVSNTAFDRIPSLGTENHSPDDILILIGINDLIRGTSPETLSSDYNRMLDELQTVYPLSNLILFTYPQVYGYFSSSIRQCNQIIRQAAANHGLVVIDLEDWNIEEEEISSYLRTDDTLHPNQEGQRVMGKMAAEQLTQIPVTEYSFSIETSNNIPLTVDCESGSFQIAVLNNSTSEPYYFYIIVIACPVILLFVIFLIYLVRRHKKYL